VLPALCLVHCLAAPVAASVLPAAVAPLAESSVLEWSLWGLAAAVCMWFLLRTRPAPRWPVRALGLALVAGAGLALALEWETTQRASMLGLAVFQVALVWRGRPGRGGAPDACCETPQPAVTPVVRPDVGRDRP
jgi:hypothetical protein